MNPEVQLAHCIGNKAEIVLTNEKNDEFTTADNDILFETPLMDVKLLTKQMYKDRIRNCLQRRYCVLEHVWWTQ